MDTEALINSLCNAPQFVSLKKEVIEIPPRKILVMEECQLTNARRGRIDVETKNDPLLYEFIDPSEKLGLSRLYVDLASVSFGDVPTFIEFCAMRSNDLSVWLEKAVEINPTMFAWINEMAKAIEQVNEEIIKALQEEADKKKLMPQELESG